MAAVYTPLSAILRHAGVKLSLRRPKGAGGKRHADWLWPEQAEAIFTEAEKINPEFAALLIVLCYTGMRLSEALGLTWDRVRLEDGFAYLPDTKNDDPRAVFLPPVAVAALGNLHVAGAARVFRFRKSGHLYSLLKACAFKAGVDLPERSAFHIFRRTYATWMRRYAGLDAVGLLAKVAALKMRSPFWSFCGRPRHTFEAGCVVYTAFAVAQILGVRSLAEIGDSIVRRIAIDVINIAIWPAAVNPQPSKTVSFVLNAIDPNAMACRQNIAGYKRAAGKLRNIKERATRQME